MKIQKSRKEALSPKENTKQVGLLKKVNGFQGNTTRLPPLLSSSLARAGVEVAVQEHDLDSTQGMT